METKPCNKCKVVKSLDDYPRTSVRKGGGKEGICKECKRAYQKEWKKKNKDKVKAYNKANEEKFKEQHKIWYEKNKERMSELARKRYENNKEHFVEYRKINRERDREQAKRWRNTERGNALSRTNTHKYRARKKNVVNDLTAEQWLRIKCDFNDCCVYCGITNVTLEQEHVTPVSKGGGLTDRNILPSCRGCNATKSNKDFLDWYKTHDHYSVENERHIVEYLNNKGANINYELELK